MTHARRCHLTHRDRLAESLLFMGCASTWGLAVLLLTAMLADVRFRPLDPEQIKAVLNGCLEQGMPCMAPASVIVFLAGLASTRTCPLIGQRSRTQNTPAHLLAFLPRRTTDRLCTRGDGASTY